MSAEKTHGRGEKNPTTYIPVHTSDRATFKRCRRRWHFSSPMQMNLRPKVSYAGVIWPLWFGTGIHYALEQAYDAEVAMDPVTAFDHWWDGELAKIHNQSDSYVDDNQDDFDHHYDLGYGMMEYYRDMVMPQDNFTVTATEDKFSIPMGVSSYDWRSKSFKPVHYEGKRDAIIRDNETGELGILEHKTADSMGEDYFDKLDLDEQCTSYLYAAREEGYDVRFVLYNVLRKRYPRSPTVLLNGRLSVDRDGEGTTLAQFVETASKPRTNAKGEVFEDSLIGTDWWMSDKVVAYRDYLANDPAAGFNIRKKVLRNQYQLESAAWRIKQEIDDMLPAPHIYPNPTADWYCLRCPFRAPCLMTEDGSDPSYTLEENYEPNTDR